jgi:hypothetical protein
MSKHDHDLEGDTDFIVAERVIDGVAVNVAFRVFRCGCLARVAIMSGAPGADEGTEISFEDATPAMQAFIDESTACMTAYSRAGAIGRAIFGAAQAASEQHKPRLDS